MQKLLPGCDSVYLHYPQEETVAELRTVEGEAASFPASLPPPNCYLKNLKNKVEEYR